MAGYKKNDVVGSTFPSYHSSIRSEMKLSEKKLPRDKDGRVLPSAFALSHGAPKGNIITLFPQSTVPHEPDGADDMPIEYCGERLARAPKPPEA